LQVTAAIEQAIDHHEGVLDLEGDGDPTLDPDHPETWTDVITPVSRSGDICRLTQVAWIRSR
jgi:hypothetical protein